MVSVSSEDDRITDWLDDIEVNSPTIDPAQPPVCRTTSNSRSVPPKRKLAFMDDRTPTTKKTRVEILTLTPTQSLRRTTSVDTRSSTTTSRSRSSSPSKRKHELLFVTPSIAFQEEEDLVLRQQEFERTIPCFGCLMQAVQSAQSRLPKSLETFLRSRLGPFKPALFLPFSEDEDLDIFADLAPNIKKWSTNIKLCREENVTEDEWCDKLVYPMLEAAADRLGGFTRVEVANVKTIDVSPPALLPTDETHRSRRKRVDYTICSKLPDKRKVVKLLKRYATHSFTQSIHERLWNRVMFSAVEVKRRKSARDGESQLTVWTAAGFKKLQEIRDWHRQTSWTRPAAQPLWLWEDDELKLYIALMETSDEMVVYPVAEWQLKQDAQLVSALICITKIMQWATTKYLPWYKSLVGYVDDGEDTGERDMSADTGGDLVHSGQSG